MTSRKTRAIVLTRACQNYQWLQYSTTGSSSPEPNPCQATQALSTWERQQPRLRLDDSPPKMNMDYEGLPSTASPIHVDMASIPLDETVQTNYRIFSCCTGSCYFLLKCPFRHPRPTDTCWQRIVVNFYKSCHSLPKSFFIQCCPLSVLEHMEEQLGLKEGTPRNH